MVLLCTKMKTFVFITMVGRNGACTVVHNNVKIRDKQIKKKGKQNKKQVTRCMSLEFK